jgi:spore coat protein U-like protein
MKTLNNIVSRRIYALDRVCIRARTKLLFQFVIVFSMTCVATITQAAVSCSVSATGPNFGNYNPLNASPTLANGSLTATCTLLSGGTTNVSLTSSFSTGSSGTFSNRTMLSGASVLNYNIYLDAAFTQIRGDGTGGSQTGSATLTLTRSAPTAQASGTIYGRMPAGQDVAAGFYSDTIILTVFY